jgi:short subunit dehydrogenase-like uncharacterized protein
MSSSPRIVVFGATGYTGELIVEALVALGISPVLAGRSAVGLAAIAERHGGLEVQIADGSDLDSVRALVRKGDVLVTGVGPFARYGWAAAQAAAEAGAHYIDTTGEVGFVRDLHDRFDAVARDNGGVMLPAMGYDYVPGILAGELAVAEAGDRAHSLDIGYFASGPLREGLSQGTRKTLADGLTLPVTVLDDGVLTDRRAAQDVISMPVDGRQRSSILASGTEILQLPSRHSQLRNVRVFNGWFPELARVAQIGSFVASWTVRSPRGRSLLDTLLARTPGPPGGPDAVERAKVRGQAVAVARAADDTVLSTVQVDGPSPYSVTADLVALAARELAAGKGQQAGVVGPIDGLGEDGFRELCATAGLARV